MSSTKPSRAAAGGGTAKQRGAGSQQNVSAAQQRAAGPPQALPWSQEFKESSLRTMRLPAKVYKQRFQKLLDWITKTFEAQASKQKDDDKTKADETTTAAAAPPELDYEHSKPSLSTQYAMALLLLRLSSGPLQKHHTVGDLVHVYFRLQAPRRDWSVVSTASWCWQALDKGSHLFPQFRDTVTTAAAGSSKGLTPLADIRRLLRDCSAQAEQASTAFHEFWKVWDTVSPIFCNPNAGYQFPAADPAAAAAAAAAAGGKGGPPPPAPRDPTHDILIVAWKLACLVLPVNEPGVTTPQQQQQRSTPLLAPTTAFSLLLAVGYWNRRGKDTADGSDTDKAKKSDTDKSDAAAASSKQDASKTTPPPGAAVPPRVVVPPVHDAAFLPWLVSAVQMPSPATRPFASSGSGNTQQPPPPAGGMTVQQVQAAMENILRNTQQEFARMNNTAGHGNSQVPPASSSATKPVAASGAKDDADKSSTDKDPKPATTPSAPKDETAKPDAASAKPSSSWLQDLETAMSKLPDVTPDSLYHKLAQSLVFQCGRLMRGRVCDLTHLVNYYLDTGRNPAAAMNGVAAGSTTAAAYYHHHQQYAAAQRGGGGGPAAGAAAPPPGAAAPYYYGPPLPPPAAGTAFVGRGGAAAPPRGVVPGAKGKSGAKTAPTAVGSGAKRSASSTAAAASSSSSRSSKRSKPLETEYQKKVELTLNPSHLAAAMELAVAETKKLGDPNNKTPDFIAHHNANAVTPPVITEAMELTEWSVSLFSLETVRPSKKLRRYLEAASSAGGASPKASNTAGGGAAAGGSGNKKWTDVMIPILNKALLKLAQEALPRGGKAPRAAPVSVIKDPDAGLVQIHGDITADKQLGKAVIALYYHALEAVLFVESMRLNVTSHPQIVLYPVFHRALLACCCWCVTKAVGVTQKLRSSPSLQAIQIHSTLMVTDSNPYDFLKVSESFMKSLTADTARGKLGSPLIFSLPRILQKDLKQIEINVADALLWAKSAKMQGSLPEQIEDFQEKTEDKGITLWPPEVVAPTLQEEVEDIEGLGLISPVYPTPEHEDYAEYRCVNFMIRKVIKLAFFRIEALCRFLDVPPEVPVVNQAWVAFRYLVRYRIDLLYDRHIDHWILCCIYGVAKLLKYQPELTFARIIEAYVVVRGPELGDVTCQRIVRHIKIAEDSNDPSNSDNIIVLYNRVFVPEMKQLLLGSKSLKRNAAELQQQQNPSQPPAAAPPQGQPKDDTYAAAAAKPAEKKDGGETKEDSGKATTAPPPAGKNADAGDAMDTS